MKVTVVYDDGTTDVVVPTISGRQVRVIVPREAGRVWVGNLFGSIPAACGGMEEDAPSLQECLGNGTAYLYAQGLSSDGIYYAPADSAQFPVPQWVKDDARGLPRS
jgi:hypothetical protein